MNDSHDSPDSALPILDEIQLEAIFGGDRDFELSVVGDFRTTTVTAIDELARAIAARDLATVRSRAHAIKGSSATLGGVALAHTCLKLEQLDSAAPDWAAAESLCADVRSGYEVLERALSSRVAAA